MPTLSVEAVLDGFAEPLFQRITHRVIRSLQSQKDGMQSGDDSPLANLWEEVCVQVQGEHSFFWEQYEDAVLNLIAREVEQLPWHERAALWFCTQRGQYWIGDEPERQEQYGVDIDEITEHAAQYYVFPAAAGWSNNRIRTALGQH